MMPVHGSDSLSLVMQWSWGSGAGGSRAGGRSCEGVVHLLSSSLRLGQHGSYQLHMQNTSAGNLPSLVRQNWAISAEQIAPSSQTYKFAFADTASAPCVSFTPANRRGFSRPLGGETAMLHRLGILDLHLQIPKEEMAQTMAGLFSDPNRCNFDTKISRIPGTNH